MFAATPDQELLADSTDRFLADRHPVDELRDVGRNATFDPGAWREGAALGWTSLLVPEALGGGSVSGNGVADLAVVARLFGRHAAPGPLLGTNAVAAALGRWGTSAQQAGPLAELLAGESVAAWGHAATVVGPPRSRAEVVARPVDGGFALTGRVAAVEAAADADHLLVTASGPGGRTQHLVPMAASGVERDRLNGVDLTRRYEDVVLHEVVVPEDSVVGHPGDGDEHDAELLDLVATVLLAEMVGAMQRAFALTLEWTVDRYTFGRPLGSYQAIKHRMADLRTQLEASAAITARAAGAVGRGDPDARALVSAGMAYVARHAPELVQECIQLHGGIGVTFEHDLHLFLRRALVDATLYGTAKDFERRLGALVVAAGERVA